MYYSEDIVEQVRQSADVVDLISNYVNLKRTGSNYVGLCPFHNEKTPSFSVSPSKQMYYCFGCHKGGNVFTFLMEYENLTFVEALEQLASNTGIKLPEKENDPKAKQVRDKREVLRKIYKLAATYYYSVLKSERGQAGYEYLKNRGLDDETIRKFGLGFSEKSGASLYKYLKNQGFNENILNESGLFKQGQYGPYDKFWNRVMFPILDKNSHVIAFGGRVLGDAKPKYLNSPETILFDKSRNLYGLNLIHGKADYLILCEGYMDVIALHRAGFDKAVASLGTALTSQHCNIIKRYTDKVYLCYDSDGAGINAAMRAIPLLKEVGISSKIINMDPYKDPDEFIKNLSKEEFQKRIEEAKISFFFEVDNIKKQYDVENPEDLTKFYKEIAKKCLSFENEIERNNYINAFAREYNIRLEDFKREVARQSANMVGIDYDSKILNKRRDQSKESGIEKSQGILLTWLSNNISLFERTKDILSEKDFVDEPYGEVANLLYTQYRTDNKVQPAIIINKFQSKEEQSLVAGIFNKEIEYLENDDEKKKSFEEVVRTVKRYSIDYRSRNITDLKELPKIIEEKKKIQVWHL